VQALRAQLAFAPPDFFDDELSADNFLRRAGGGRGGCPAQPLDSTHRSLLSRSALGGLAARSGAEPLAKAEGQQALAPALAAEACPPLFCELLALPLYPVLPSPH